MYIVLINLPLNQSISEFFTLHQFGPFYTLKCLVPVCEVTTPSSYMPIVGSDIIVSIPTASLFPYAILNPNYCSRSTSSSILLSMSVTVFAACVMRLTVWWSLHFVASDFFFKAVIVTSEILVPSTSLMHIVDQFFHYFETIFSQQGEYVCRYIIMSCSCLIFHLLYTFSHFTVQTG